MTPADILPQLQKMSYNDQLIIADELFRLLSAERSQSREEFQAELDRRVEEMETHPETTISWEQLDQELDHRAIHADTHPESLIPWDEAIRQLRTRA